MPRCWKDESSGVPCAIFRRRGWASNQGPPRRRNRREAKRASPLATASARRGLFVRRLRGCAERSRAVRGVPAAGCRCSNSGVDGATPAQAEVGHAPEQRGRGRGRGRGPPRSARRRTSRFREGKAAIEGAPARGARSPTPGREPFTACQPPSPAPPPPPRSATAATAGPPPPFSRDIPFPYA